MGKRRCSAGAFDVEGEGKPGAGGTVVPRGRAHAPSNAIKDDLGNATPHAGAAKPFVVLRRAWQRRFEGAQAGDVIGIIAQLTQHIGLIIDDFADVARRIPVVIAHLLARRARRNRPGVGV